MSVAPNIVLGQNLEIHWPLDRAVFQRNSLDQATVTIQGQYSSGISTMKYRLYKLKLKEGTNDGLEENWTDIIPYHDNSIHKVFRKNFSKSKGWYRIDFSTDGNNISKSIKFGVGDVYVIAGQSNAQGFDFDAELDAFFNKNEFINKYGQYYDCVNVMSRYDDCDRSIKGLTQGNNHFVMFERPSNGRGDKLKFTPKGVDTWCWDILGTEISISQSCPIAFFNAAASSSSVYHWAQTADNNNAGVVNFYDVPNIYCGTNGAPYIYFKNTLNMYSSIFGVKAVLWHQGETDTQFNSSFENNSSYPDIGNLVNNYNFRLQNKVINKSYSDFKNGLSWFISKASIYYNGSYIGNNTLTGIQQSIANNNKEGVSTDGVLGNYTVDGSSRKSREGVHFNNWGLYWLGKEWVSKQPWTGNPIAGEELLPIIINGNQLSISPVSGATNYIWVKNDNLQTPFQSGNSATCNYTNDGATYRCYVIKDGKNYQISEAYKSEIIVGINYLTVTPSVPVNYSSASQILEIGINSFSNWSVSSSNWIHPTVTSGVAGNNWAFNCNIDANGGGSRQGSIVVTNNNSSQTIYINQAAGLDIIPTPSVKDVGVNSFYTTANINAINTSWTATTSDGWFAISPTSGGFGDTNMAIQINANTGPSRTGIINIMGSGISKTISINQAGSSLNTCSDCVGYLDGAWCPTAAGWAKRNGQTTNFDIYIDGQLVQSNVAPNYDRPDVGGYFGLNYTYPECYRNGQNHEIVFKYAGTSTTLANSPKMFNCTGGNCSGGNNNLSVIPTNVSFTNLSGNQNTTINSTNINWIASESLDWLTLGISSGGNGNTVMPVNVQQNTTSTPRTGIVSVSGGSYSNSVNVLQNGEPNNTCNNCEGYLDGAWCPVAGGWAKKNGGSTSIDIYIDGQLVQSNFTPNYNRPDVGGYFGFNYTYPECYQNGQNHSISFKYTGTGASLYNSPQTFNCSGGNCNTNSNLTVSNGSLAFISSISTQSVNVNSTNTNWVALPSAGWVTVTPSSGGNGITPISISVQQNSQNTNRIGNVLISGNGYSQMINITQDATNTSNTCNNCEGYLDGAWCPVAGGWAKKNGSSTNIDIYINGQLVQSNFAPNYDRPDVGGYFGFTYNYPECVKNGQNHTLSFKHTGTNTELNNSPQIFNCTGGNCGSRLATTEQIKLVELIIAKDVFVIFPNPTNDKLTTKFSLAEASNVSFEIVDMQGRNLADYNYKGEAGLHTFIIDVSKLHTGSYLLRGLLGSKLEVKRFVVER